VYFESYIDEIVHCETNELAPLMEIVRPRHDQTPFNAFMTMGEYDVVVATEAARLLKLPTADSTAVAEARNKVLMRERCARHGVPRPAFRAVTTAEEAVAAAKAVGLPCVVKPADETSSVDVLRCDTVAMVERHFNDIRAKQRNTRGQDRYPRVLVEECVHGYEVSVEILAEGDRYHVFGVTDKSVAGNGTFVEISHVFPSLLPPATAAACADVAVAALRAVRFDLGLAHVEVKVGGDGPRLIEINPRPAGDKITRLVDAALGMSCLELMVRQYLGEPVMPELRTEPRRGAAIRFLTAPAGVVTSVSGTEVARAMPGVTEVVVSAVPGTHIRPLRRNADRGGYVLALPGRHVRRAGTLPWYRNPAHGCEAGVSWIVGSTACDSSHSPNTGETARRMEIDSGPRLGPSALAAGPRRGFREGLADLLRAERPGGLLTRPHQEREDAERQPGQ
jgi:biotin carboxylase